MRRGVLRRDIFFVFGSTIVVILAAFLMIRSDFFTIKSVKVQLDKVTCADWDQIKNSSNLSGQNLILLNSSKVKDVIKNKFFCVKDVQISRVFPNKVGVIVFGREPKALLLVFKDNEATQSANIENIATPSAQVQEVISNFLIDDEGVIFAKNTDTFDTPKIYYYGEELTLGQVATGSVSDSLKIIEKVKSYGLDVSISEILDGLFLIYTKPKIVFKLGENLNVQLASLQLILNQAKIGEEVLEFIDLRFDKPVVKLAPKRT